MAYSDSNVYHLPTIGARSADPVEVLKTTMIVVQEDYYEACERLCHYSTESNVIRAERVHQVLTSLRELLAMMRPAIDETGRQSPQSEPASTR